MARTKLKLSNWDTEIDSIKEAFELSFNDIIRKIGTEAVKVFLNGASCVEIDDDKLSVFFGDDLEDEIFFTWDEIVITGRGFDGFKKIVSELKRRVEALDAITAEQWEWRSEQINLDCGLRSNPAASPHAGTE